MSEKRDFPRFADLVKELENVYNDDGIIIWLTTPHLAHPSEPRVSYTPCYWWSNGERALVAQAVDQLVAGAYA